MIDLLSLVNSSVSLYYLPYTDLYYRMYLWFLKFPGEFHTGWFCFYSSFCILLSNTIIYNFSQYSTMSNLFRSEFLSTFGQCSVCLKRLLPSLRRFGKSNGDKNCQTVTTETAKLVEGATENMLIKLDDLNSRSKLAAKPQYRRVSWPLWN